MKKFTALFLAFIMSLTLFAGCGTNSDDAGENAALSDLAAASNSNSNSDSKPAADKNSDEKTTLRVMVDRRSDDSTMFRDQLDEWKRKFGYTHDVEVVIEEIPTDPSERKFFIQQKNVEIMSGKGPDVMLLQNGFTTSELSGGKRAFFEDVNLAMHNGVFYDLSELYAADAELHTEQLPDVLMDAGVCEGKRYILPMRFDVPVVYVNTQAFDENGLDRGMFDSFTALFDGVAEIPDMEIVSDFDLSSLASGAHVSSDWIDYDNRRITVTSEELQEYIKSVLDYYDARESAPFYRGSILPIRFKDYYSVGQFWADDGLVVNISSLQDVLENLLIAKLHGVELEMFPMRTMDGSVVAEITFYGAVGAGCKDPELAYKFIREFLTENQQWGKFNSAPYDKYFAAPGWPVRVSGSAKALKDNFISYHADSSAYVFKDIPLVDGDIPVINAVDKACFSVDGLNRSIGGELWSIVLEKRTNPNLQPDYEELSKKLIKTLRAHLDEG